MDWNIFACYLVVTSLSILNGKNTAFSQNISALIPRRVIFAPPDYSGLSLSPDGLLLSMVIHINYTPNVWIRRLPNDTPEQMTHETGRGVSCAQWAFDNETLLYHKDTDGDENWSLHALNIKSTQSLLLAGSLNSTAKILKTSTKHPYSLIIGINDRSPQYYDAYSVDIRTGEKILKFQNDQYKDLFFDEEFNLRFSTKVAEDGGTVYYVVNPPAGGFGSGGDSPPVFVEYKRVKFDDHEFTKLMKIHKSGKIAFWLDNNDGQDDFSSFVTVKLDTGEKRVIYKPDGAEVHHVLYHPVTDEPLMITIHREKPQYIYLDEHFGIEMEQARDALMLPERGHDTADTDVRFVSGSFNFSYWILSKSSDTLPSAYFSYNVVTKDADFMFHSREELLQYHMAPMKSVRIPISDNLTQLCYLTTPLRSKDEAGGTGPQPPVPTILHVHGGPRTRDYWGFVEKVQYFASRGYATLRCNFRSSTGFGKKFLNAGNGEWGAKMQKDLTDATNWLIANKIALPDKIAIYGGSYGGYAVLSGLTTTPDLYACGVDIVGPSNLVSLLESMPAYWMPRYKDLVRQLGGDPKTPEGRDFLRSRSPVFYVANITRPLFIAHGQQDVRVNVNQTMELLTALSQAQKPVTYLQIPNEGHGFIRPENNFLYFAHVENFLAKCLGGALEPMGDENSRTLAMLISTNYVTIRKYVTTQADEM